MFQIVLNLTQESYSALYQAICNAINTATIEEDIEALENLLEEMEI